MSKEIIKNNENDSVVLKSFLYRIPYGQYNAMVTKLVQACLVSKYTFNNWRNGACRIPLAAKRDMNEVSLALYGEKIFPQAPPELTDLEGVSEVSQRGALSLQSSECKS